jgi:MFS family permease
VRLVGGVGLALMGAGFLVFTQLDVDSSYWLFGTGALITGIGLALATAPATTAIVSSLPAHRQGIASAVNDLSREVGGAFGIAILGSVLNSVYRDDAPAAAQGSVAAAAQGALDQAQRAFVNGFSAALLVGALVLFAAAALVALLAPRREPASRRHPSTTGRTEVVR